MRRLRRNCRRERPDHSKSRPILRHPSSKSPPRSSRSIPPRGIARSAVDETRRMPRTQTVLAAGSRHGDIVDTLLLNFADRRKQQGFVFGGKGTCIEFDFPEPPRLRTDDLLVLDDGTLVEVVADAEPLLELRVTDFVALARLVWVLGNRHQPVQVLTNRIRVLGSAQMKALLAERGLAATPVAAPFDPDDA